MRPPPAARLKCPIHLLHLPNILAMTHVRPFDPQLLWAAKDMSNKCLNLLADHLVGCIFENQNNGATT